MTDVDSERPPLFRPPELRTAETRAPSWLELFFDLAYVLCITQLAGALLRDLDRDGLLEYLGLFTLIWLSWTQFTLYINRFDTDDLILRLAKLIAMMAVLGAAASISDAGGSKVVPFTLSYSLGRLVIAGLYYRAWRHVDEARGTTNVYLVAMSSVAALWLVSLALPSPLRFAVWGLAALVDVAAPVVAGKRPRRAPLHLEHLPERFGLLVILVLGEAIAGVVTGVHDAQWSGVSVAVGAMGFIIAAALWWAYFDVGGTVSAHGIQRADKEKAEGDAEEHGEQPVDERHDLFVYGHLPLTAGILAVAVGVEQLVLRPDRPLPSSGGLLVTGGVVAFLVGAAVLLRAGGQRSRLSLAWPLGAAAAVAVWGAVGPHDALLSIIGTAAVTVAAAAAGAVISRRTPGKSHRPDSEVSAVTE